MLLIQQLVVWWSFLWNGILTNLQVFLTSEGVHDDIVSNVIANCVTSALFIELSDEDLKELAPTLGDRMALKKVLLWSHNYANVMIKLINCIQIEIRKHTNTHLKLECCTIYSLLANQIPASKIADIIREVLACFNPTMNMAELKIT